MSNFIIIGCCWKNPIHKNKRKCVSNGAIVVELFPRELRYCLVGDWRSQFFFGSVTVCVVVCVILCEYDNVVIIWNFTFKHEPCIDHI